MMNDELRRLRPANVAQTLVIPKPVGTHVIRARSRAAVLKELSRLEKRGYVHSASELAQYHARAGGGFGVKVALTRPLPEPVPGWAKGLALVGVVLCGLALAAAVLVRALASLIPAAAAIPWAMIAGGAVVFLLVAAFAKRAISGGGITVTQKVTIK